MPSPSIASATGERKDERAERLDWIEWVLKFDPHHPDKKQLVKEYLALTEKESSHAA